MMVMVVMMMMMVMIQRKRRICFSSCRWHFKGKTRFLFKIPSLPASPLQSIIFSFTYACACLEKNNNNNRKITDGHSSFFTLRSVIFFRSLWITDNNNKCIEEETQTWTRSAAGDLWLYAHQDNNYAHGYYIHSETKNCTPFYFCSNFAKPLYIKIIIGSHIPRLIWNKMISIRSISFNSIFVMSCEKQHTYTCHNQCWLRHVSLNVNIIEFSWVESEYLYTAPNSLISHNGAGR